ncbi:YggS family pyridoxal phosphate-dependent enzyme [Candidatus Electronema sp. JM]|uniref:YggS family pyridoxal phosphate-dependent enzyme n=1 Tax=Candidatus Electronema sp. JM TaxID=3401571 RepID=UPI003AA8C097
MIGDNLAHIRAAVREAALRCGRNPDAIKIVAVSKHVAAARLIEAQVHGQTIFGENYLQEAAGKINQLHGPLEWHFIGHLQSNKAATAAELFQVIQTVDRLKIAAALNQHAGRLGKTLDVLVQVNVGREAQKSGVLPEDAAGLLRELRLLVHLRVRGLMTMPPLGREPEESRPWFRSLKQLSLQLTEEGLFYDNSAVELSMGLSGDFTVAIEEGATMIRIGTAIFGERPKYPTHDVVI